MQENQSEKADHLSPEKLSVCERLWLLPVFTVLWIVLSCCATYAIAVGKGHVDPGWPYVSDTGALAPESSVFTFGFGVAAVLMFINIWLKFKHSYLRYGSKISNRMKKVNHFAHICGQFSVLGFVIIACVPETVSLWVHLAGAILTMGFGMIYGLGQSYHTYLAAKDKLGPSKPLAFMRFFFVIIGLLALIVAGSLALARVILTKDLSVPVRVQKHTTAHKIHVGSSSCEWIAGVAYLLLILTFAHEFWELSMNPPRLFLSQKPRNREQDVYRTDISWWVWSLFGVGALSILIIISLLVVKCSKRCFNRRAVDDLPANSAIRAALAADLFLVQAQFVGKLVDEPKIELQLKLQKNDSSGSAVEIVPGYNKDLDHMNRHMPSVAIYEVSANSSSDSQSSRIRQIQDDMRLHSPTHCRTMSGESDNIDLPSSRLSGIITPDSSCLTSSSPTSADAAELRSVRWHEWVKHSGSC